jgi:hypothetical protein
MAMNTQQTTGVANESTLVTRQFRTFGPKPVALFGDGSVKVEMTATVRYDDRCGNGHNTLSVTADLTDGSGGACHELIAEHFPELVPLIKWHLVSTDGPMHYIENTMYWLGRRGWCTGKPNDPPNLAYARKSACWPDMPEGYVITGTLVSNAFIEAHLAARLPDLLEEFRAAVESLGLEF